VQGEPARDNRHGHDHHHDDDHGRGGHTGLKARLLGWLLPHSHDHTSQIDPTLVASDEGIRATKLGLLLLGATSIVQLAVALFAGSVALFADVVHNVADASTSIPLWFAFALGRRASNRRFTYGYKRSEDLAGLFIVLMIAASAVLVGWESVGRLLNPEPMTHTGWVFLAGVVGVVGNELAAVVRIRAGKRIGSAALIADGMHARTDTMASLAVIVAVVGTWLGFPIADAIVGLVIAFLILWILKETATTTLRRLMDGVDELSVARIERALGTVDGVEHVDWVRARWAGHRMFVDAAISVDAEMTVREGHDTAMLARTLLLSSMPEIESVMVHVNPHGDGHPAI
jgi:cation diffusion facilitator family transporter